MDSERHQEDVVITDKKAVIELLELYKDFPCLWDTAHSLYCNKDARNQAFQILLEKWKSYYPLATITEIKKKIERLRAAYRRERNKVESSKASGAGVEDLRVPALWYYQHLSFLHEKTNPTSEIIDNFETNNDNGSIEEPVTKKEKSSIRRQSAIFKKQEELLESARQLVNANSSSELTSADAFGQSVGSQLKELPKMQRLICEKLIGELFFYAKLGELNLETSISINSHYIGQPHNKPVLQYQLHTPKQSVSSMQPSPCQPSPSPSPQHSHPSQYQPSPSPSPSPHHSHQYQYQPSPSPSPHHSHQSQYQPSPSPSPQHSHPSQYQPSPSPSPHHSHQSQYQPSPSPSPHHSHPSQYQPSPSPSPHHSHPSQYQPSPSPSPHHSHQSQYQPSPSPSPQHSHPSQYQPSPSPSPHHSHQSQYQPSPQQSRSLSFQSSLTSAHARPPPPQTPTDELLEYIIVPSSPPSNNIPSEMSQRNVFRGKGTDIHEY